MLTATEAGEILGHTAGLAGDAQLRAQSLLQPGSTGEDEQEKEAPWLTVRSLLMAVEMARGVDGEVDSDAFVARVAGLARLSPSRD